MVAGYKFVTLLLLKRHALVFEEETLPDLYAIGTFNAFSPVTLASAYSAFGNNGVRVTPHSYTKIVYR